MTHLTQLHGWHQQWMTQVVQPLRMIQDQVTTALAVSIQEARHRVAISKEKKMLTELDLEKDLITEMTKETILDTKVRSMFFMQNELNSLIDNEWFNHKHWDFQRASMIELGELMDHYGYKWWKKQEPNVDQCKLEVIDILHFHISHLIQVALRDSHKYDFYASELAENLTIVNVDKSPESVRALIDEAIFLASSKNFSSKALGFLMNAFEITPDELCNKYIIKNTLNIFRASNGYKQGTYIKTWNGREDNEVLMEIFATMDSNSPSLASDLYVKLEETYKALL